MLFFANVTTDALPAITHVDGTARVQSVGPTGDPRFRDLLEAQSRRTGLRRAVQHLAELQGPGLHQPASDLFHYCERTGIDHAVIEDAWYRRLRRLARGGARRTGTCSSAW